MEASKQIHKGVIKLGEYDLPCYVVDDGEKVERYISQTDVVKLISGGRESGNLQRYLSSKALQETLPSEIANDYEANILIINTGLNTVNGLKASAVVDICNSYLKARQLGILRPNQVNLAEQSEIFISALAKTGIDAIIDEATGYQYFRKANDLQAKFDAYLIEGYREYTKLFPREFFMHLYRLEGQTPPMVDSPYPKRFGKYVMHYVYDTLDPEIADFLRENNPNPGGQKHHHQKFNDFGHKALNEHLFTILGIAKSSINMERFKESLAFAFPNHRTRRRARLAENKKDEKKDEKQLQIDFLPNANTIDLFSESDKNKIEDKNELSDFNNKLKQGLEWNPKVNKKA